MLIVYILTSYTHMWAQNKRLGKLTMTLAQTVVWTDDEDEWYKSWLMNKTTESRDNIDCKPRHTRVIVHLLVDLQLLMRATANTCTTCIQNVYMETYPEYFKKVALLIIYMMINWNRFQKVRQQGQFSESCSLSGFDCRCYINLKRSFQSPGCKIFVPQPNKPNTKSMTF